MQRLWKKIIVVGMVVVLGSIGLFLSHGSGWRARRAYAQDPPTITITGDTASIQSGIDQTFTFNVYNGTGVTLGGFLDINNEDGTAQTAPIPFTVLPNNNAQIPYTPPSVPMSPTSSVLVNESFVPHLVLNFPSALSMGRVCANLDIIDESTGDLQVHFPFILTRTNPSPNVLFTPYLPQGECLYTGISPSP